MLSLLYSCVKQGGNEKLRGWTQVMRVMSNECMIEAVPARDVGIGLESAFSQSVLNCGCANQRDVVGNPVELLYPWVNTSNSGNRSNWREILRNFESKG